MNKWFLTNDIACRFFGVLQAGTGGRYFKGESEMSKVCEICGKRPRVGYSVSHAHNKTKTRWEPNLQKVRSVQNGQVKRIKVCTSCIKSGRIVKP